MNKENSNMVVDKAQVEAVARFFGNFDIAHSTANRTGFAKRTRQILNRKTAYSIADYVNELTTVWQIKATPGMVMGCLDKMQKHGQIKFEMEKGKVHGWTTE